RSKGVGLSRAAHRTVQGPWSIRSAAGSHAMIATSATVWGADARRYSLPTTDMQARKRCRYLGGISELSINAALAMIEAARRRTKLRQRSPCRWPAHTQPQWPFSPSWIADLEQSDGLRRLGRLRLVCSERM